MQNYNRREKLLLKTDLNFLEKSVTLDGDFLKRYEKWSKKLKEFFEIIPEDTNVFVVFIPHCAQVNSLYFKNMKELGANFSEEQYFKKQSYKFYEQASSDFKSDKNITFLNALKYLRDEDDFKLYYANDPHFNNNGNIVLAEYINKNVLNKK